MSRGVQDGEIFAKPLARLFSSTEHDLLARQLRDLDDATEYIVIDQPEDIRLDLNAKVGGIYRYTSASFRAVCHALSPGVAELFRAVAGVYRRPDDAPDFFSLHEAVQIYNTVVSRRWSKLAGARLVVDLRSNRIDALIGPKTKTFDNSTVLEVLDDVFAGTRPIHQFNEAHLVGRTLVVRYLAKAKPISIFPASEVREDLYQTGFHVFNADSGGSSIRASAMLQRLRDGGTALAPVAAHNRLVRTGHDLPARFQYLMAAVAEYQPPISAIQAGAVAAMAHNLGLGVLPKARKQRQTQLVDWFYSHTVPRRLAERVVRFLPTYEAFETNVPKIECVREAGQRTAYDLFCAAMVVAQDLHMALRERLERAAYRLLMKGLLAS